MSARKSYKYTEMGHRIGTMRRAKSVRTGESLTQQDVADALNVEIGTVTAWETGRQRPLGENLAKLAALLEVEPHEITGEDVPRETKAATLSDEEKAAAWDQLGALLRQLINPAEREYVLKQIREIGGDQPENPGNRSTRKRRRSG